MWFDVRERAGANVFHDDDDEARQIVYQLAQPSSHYYQVMTGSEWMLCLVRQRIEHRQATRTDSERLPQATWSRHFLSFVPAASHCPGMRPRQHKDVEGARLE
jgi:hypothetical protein